MRSELESLLTWNKFLWFYASLRLEWFHNEVLVNHVSSRQDSTPLLCSPKSIQPISPVLEFMKNLSGKRRLSNCDQIYPAVSCRDVPPFDIVIYRTFSLQYDFVHVFTVSTWLKDFFLTLMLLSPRGYRLQSHLMFSVGEKGQSLHLMSSSHRVIASLECLRQVLIIKSRKPRLLTTWEKSLEGIICSLASPMCLVTAQSNDQNASFGER